MDHRHPVAVVVAVLITVATLGAEKRWIDVERSTVTLHILASGTQHPAAVPGHVIEAPPAEGSLDDTDTPHLTIVINVDEFRVVDPERSVHERQLVKARLLDSDGLDAERFSRVTYHSLSIDQGEAGVWLVHGELEMHGKFLPLDVRAVRQGDRFTGTATVLPADFGIPPMRIGETSALVGHEVRVDFDVVLEAP